MIIESAGEESDSDEEELHRMSKDALVSKVRVLQQIIQDQKRTNLALQQSLRVIESELLRMFRILSWISS